jgi:hypothetical protein
MGLLAGSGRFCAAFASVPARMSADFGLEARLTGIEGAASARNRVFDPIFALNLQLKGRF